ncbi:SMI1/KNR4 family protein [Patescibacteria group bacterium]
MKTSKKVITNNKSIDAAEKELGFKYPQKLRKLLKERNGFYLAHFRFYGVLDKEDIQHTFDDIVRENTNQSSGWRKYLPKGHIAIADDTGTGCLTLTKQNDGRIYYWNNDIQKLSVYARSVSELIRKLEKKEEDYIRESEELEKTHLKGRLRIKYGFEKEDWEADKYKCHDCGVTRGQVHIFGCDVESCPICKEQLISCGHFQELLPKQSNLGLYPKYDNPAEKEYFLKFLTISSMDNLEKKFLVFQRKDQVQKIVLYCDKVLVGETLRQAIERVLETNVGINEVYDIFVGSKEESDTNKYGEILPRVVISSTSVKYTSLKLNFSFPLTAKWVNRERFNELLSNSA